LSEEERGYWLAIVSPFPPARFQADAMPTLIELVRAMGRSRKLAEELDGLRQTKLVGPSPERAKVRALFCQLARQARAEAALVAVLSTKLRMVDQSKTREARGRSGAAGDGTWNAALGAGVSLRCMALAQRHRLPAIYVFRKYVTEGALISHGPNTADIVRRSAAYVDRILKGEKPADLPVQAPTKYDLVINLQIARARVRSAADSHRPRRRVDRMNAASSSRCSVARRWRGRSRRGRSIPSGCGASACSFKLPSAIRRHESKSRRFCEICRSWAGAKVA
jgi:hypothetical protein